MNKKTTQVTISLLFVLTLLIGILCLIKIGKLKQELKYESMKQGFYMNNNVVFDSTYCNKNTVYFYKNGELLGSSTQD